MKKNVLAILTISILISSCGKKERSDLYFFNDFENYSDWGIEAGNVYKGKAHSWNHFVKVDAEHEFSLTLRKNFTDFDYTQVKKVRISCWAFCKEINSDAVFVLSIDGQNKSYLWSGLEVKTLVDRTSQWVKMETVVDFPKNIPSDAHISLYGWSKDKREVLFDDFELELIK